MKNKFVLIADYISRPQADRLHALGVPFFDAAGNAFFKEPGLFVFVTGRKSKAMREKVPRLFRPPGMKMLFALLTNPGLEKSSYRHISEKTNVPTPTVGVFMKDLVVAGYISKSISGDRRLLRRDELFRRFVENYAERFKPALNPVRFRAERFEGRWWEKIDLSEFAASWGGEAGGALLTRYLKPASATIYADSLLPRFQVKYRLYRDPHGTVEIVRKFWPSPAVSKVVHPLIVYSELMATADGRNIETAGMVFDEYLANLI